MEHKIEHLASLLTDVMRTSVTIEETVSRRWASIISGRSTPSTATGHLAVSASSGVGLSDGDEHTTHTLSPTFTGE